MTFPIGAPIVHERLKVSNVMNRVVYTGTKLSLGCTIEKEHVEI